MNALSEEIKQRKVRKNYLQKKLDEIRNDIYNIDQSSHEVYDLAYKINNIYQKCTLYKLKKSTYNIFTCVILEIQKEIPAIISKYGCKFQLFIKYFPVDIDTTYKTLLCNVFEVRKIEKVVSEETVPELDPAYNEFARKKEFFFRKIYPSQKNDLEENINGSKIFFPYKKSYIIVFGIFKDNLKFGMKSLRKFTELMHIVSKGDFKNKKFLMNFIESCSVRDILVNNSNEFLTNAKNAFKDLKQLEEKSFNDVQKIFQNSSIFKQRRMIFILLLSDEKAKQYCIPMLESLKHIHDRKSIINSLDSLGNRLVSIKNNIQTEINQFESSYDDISCQNKIMMLKIDNNVKSKALEKLKESNSGRESGTKAQQYVDGLLKIPFGVYKKETIFSENSSDDSKKNYLSDVRYTLENCVHGHTDAKRHIERLIGQWMSGKNTGTVFGFQGPPGTGKTTLAKYGIADCLKDENGDSRPISFIPIGGSSSGSYLEGHGYTYMGSTWGKIVDVLIETQCMNPIIYIDELDKISQSERGQELIGILTHLTDSTQNSEFSDKYFSGIKFDLSQAIFIFSYNDSSKIDRILKDRITEIKTSALFKKDKLIITNKFLLNEVYRNIGVSLKNVVIDNDCIEHIIDNYTYEPGVRKLKEKLYDLIREVNLLKIDNKIQFPFTITRDFIHKIFQDKPTIVLPKVPHYPSVGLVNGLYASSLGLGGLTLIEIHKTYGENLDLLLTGSQGKIMKESMECAKTVALNKLNSCESWKTFKLHIHCPEAATSKDGPSAGITVTTGIFSRLANIPVRHDIAMTGEIDLNGNVHPIGGVESKIFGAIQSSIYTIIFPKANEQDVNIFKNKYLETYNCIIFHFVEHIDEVLQLALCKKED